MLDQLWVPLRLLNKETRGPRDASSKFLLKTLNININYMLKLKPHTNTLVQNINF